MKHGKFHVFFGHGTEHDQNTNRIVEIVAVLPWLRVQARLIKGRNVAFIEYADELQAAVETPRFLAAVEVSDTLGAQDKSIMWM